MWRCSLFIYIVVDHKMCTFNQISVVSFLCYYTQYPNSKLRIILLCRKKKCFRCRKISKGQRLPEHIQILGKMSIRHTEDEYSSNHVGCTMKVKCVHPHTLMLHQITHLIQTYIVYTVPDIPPNLSKGFQLWIRVSENGAIFCIKMSRQNVMHHG